MKKHFYILVIFAFFVQSCSTKKASQFTWGGGGDYRLEQANTSEQPSQVAMFEELKKPITLQSEVIPKSEHEGNVVEEKQYSKPRVGSLKQKMQTVSTVRKIMKTSNFKRTKASDDAGMCLGNILILILFLALGLGLLALGLTIMQVALIFAVIGIVLLVIAI